MALASAIYMSLMGKHGLRQAAQLSFNKAHYAAEKLGKLKGYGVAAPQPFFNEFILRCPRPVAEINHELLEEWEILGGYDLGRDYPALKDHMLVAVTEMNTKQEMDALAEALSDTAGGAR